MSSVFVIVSLLIALLKLLRPGIDGDRTDAELQQFALEAQRRVSDNGHERDCRQ